MQPCIGLRGCLQLPPVHMHCLVLCALWTVDKYLWTSEVAVTAAAAASLESCLFSLVLETAFPGLRKRTEALSLSSVSAETWLLERELTFEKRLHFFLGMFSCYVVRTGC